MEQMTYDKMQNMVSILQAFLDGKTIQCYIGTITDTKEEFWQDILDLHDLVNGLINTSLIFRVKPEENYTIEQNTGENRIEGGITSISGFISEKKYHPYEFFDGSLCGVEE